MKIDKIHVKYFKSMYDTEFEPGNINVLIGANGSGKSTVLESIGILSAAMTDRVKISNKLLETGMSLSRLWIDGYIGGVPDLERITNFE